MAEKIANDYFDLRNVAAEAYADFKLPESVKKLLPSNKQAGILEIGCGFGQLLEALSALGYDRLSGIDLSEQAVAHCSGKGLRVFQANLLDYARQTQQKFDFIIMSHVLEHIDKDRIVEILATIKKSLLAETGQLLVIVPNAQAETGAYWRYEDFTHTTMFTSGSLHYVLRAAGFTAIKFIDSDCLDGLSLPKKLLKQLLLSLYKLNKRLWLRVTSSAYHQSSPQIFSYEIKALAS